VPRECQVIRESLRSDAVVPLDVVIPELLARSIVPEQITVTNQLRQVLVARDEGGADALIAHQAAERADDVVRFVFPVREHRQPEMTAYLATALELRCEIHRLWLTIGLVRGIDAATIRVAQSLVNGNRDVARPSALDAV